MCVAIGLHMSIRWLWVGLPVLAIGCVAPAGPSGTESEEGPLPRNDEAISVYARHKAGPPNLCVVGERRATIGGAVVTFPVPCIPEDMIEPGTPVEDELVDPDPTVEEPGMDEIDAFDPGAAADRQMR
jgi:hypothetical protein